jgi:peptidoglycan/LPS O-acetylase OafA/YrhL
MRNKDDLLGIQILRGIAALAVVIHHALEQSGGAVVRFSPDWLTTAGASGVDIFFVISGFIILRISFREGCAPTRPAQFLFRRITRIYPLYWIVCSSILALAAVGFMKQHDWGQADILPAMLLIPYPRLVLHDSWTLFYEMYFYWLLAATLIFASRTATAVMCTLCIISLWLVNAHLSVADGQLAAFLADPIALEFCLGMTLAYFGITFPPITFFIGFGLLIAAPTVVEHPSTAGLFGLSRVIAWGLPATLIVGSAIRFNASSTVLARIGVLIGDTSYSLYLSHPIVMLMYYWLLKNTMLKTVTQIPVVPLVVLVCVIVGMVLYRFVERPLLRLAAKAHHALQPRVPLPPVTSQTGSA